MKAEIKEDGIHVYAETQAESWALLGIFPPGAGPADTAKRIVIHGDPEDSREVCND